MSDNDSKHRSHLPIPTPDRTGLITYDAKAIRIAMARQSAPGEMLWTHC